MKDPMNDKVNEAIWNALHPFIQEAEERVEKAVEKYRKILDEDLRYYSGNGVFLFSRPYEKYPDHTDYTGYILDREPELKEILNRTVECWMVSLGSIIL